VDPQAAPLRGDAHQRLQDLGVLTDQGGELVDSHYQVGQGDLRWQAGDVLGAVRCQDPLPPVHLGLQGGQRPAGAERVQIGEDPGRVR